MQLIYIKWLFKIICLCQVRFYFGQCSSYSYVHQNTEGSCYTLSYYLTWKFKQLRFLLFEVLLDSVLCVETEISKLL